MMPIIVAIFFWIIIYGEKQPGLEAESSFALVSIYGTTTYA